MSGPRAGNVVAPANAGAGAERRHERRHPPGRDRADAPDGAESVEWEDRPALGYRFCGCANPGNRDHERTHVNPVHRPMRN